MTPLLITIALAVAARLLCREGVVRFENDGTDDNWWYSDGHHTERTPWEWR